MKYFWTLVGVIVLILIVLTGRKIINTTEKFQEIGWKITEKGDSFFVQLSDENVIEGNGDLVEKERPVETFAFVKCAGNITVKLQEGTEEKVVVKADSNLQDSIFVEVVDNELRLKARNIRTKGNPAEILVNYTKLEKIEALVAAKVEVQDVDTEQLAIEATTAAVVNVESLKARAVTVDLTTAAKAILSGKCDLLGVKCATASEAMLLELVADTCKVKTSTAAAAKVNAQKSLDAEANTGSSIRYIGDPTEKMLDKRTGGSIKKK